MPREYDQPTLSGYAAGLLRLTELGIPPDVQELLVYGNVEMGVPPGALMECIRAAIAHHRLESLKV